MFVKLGDGTGGSTLAGKVSYWLETTWLEVPAVRAMATTTTTTTEKKKKGKKEEEEEEEEEKKKKKKKRFREETREEWFGVA